MHTLRTILIVSFIALLILGMVFGAAPGRFEQSG